MEWDDVAVALPKCSYHGTEHADQLSRIERSESRQAQMPMIE